MKPSYLLRIVLFLAAAPACTWASAAAQPSEPVDMTHRMMMLAIQLGILLIAAKIGSMLVERRNLPGVLGESLAGIVVGPYLLGSIPMPGFSQGLFPVFSPAFAVSPELYGICAIASIILLFSIGLETDARLLLRYSGPGLAIGIGGVVSAFFVGNYASTIILPYIAPGTYTMLSPAPLFLGIIASATSVGITARVLSDMRKLDTPEGMTILAGAVIDDVLGIILLSVGMGIIAAGQVEGESVPWNEIGRIALKAVGIWLGATIIGILAARRISNTLKAARDEATIAILALGLALLLAGLFEEARLAMIIGAYVMGLSLSRTDISLVVQDFLHPMQKLLVPVFFAVMGMLVDIRMMLNPVVLIATLAFFLVANLVKIVGCGAPALLFGFNLRGALRVGAGMMPRGEVALIMAGIALSTGLLPNTAFSMVILATLLTTLAVPSLLTALFASPASGRRQEDAPAKTTQLSFQFPSHDTAEWLTAKLRIAFEAEGFFVHLVDHNTQLYRVLKDDIAIRFQCTRDTIQFACDEDQQTFINTAMLEVLAEFERAVAELRKPIDAAAILPKPGGPAAGATASTQLAAALRPALCLPALQADTKQDAIQELLDAIENAGLLQDRETAFADVMKREAMMSTGMQDGVAIPHARTAAVRQLACAIGLKPDGLDFEALDGKPSRILVLTLSPVEGGTPHIQFMAGISRFLSDAGNRSMLLHQRTGQDMLSLLSGKPDGNAPTTGLPWKTWLHKWSPGRGRSMHDALQQHLRPEWVCPDLQGQDTRAVLQELLDLLLQTHDIKSSEPILEQLLQRENEMSTAMENGVAVPHLRTDTVNRLLCAIGVHRQGIPFGAREGTPTHVFVLTLSPASGPAPHIQLMATIANRMDANTRTRCLQARSREELYQLIAG